MSCILQAFSITICNYSRSNPRLYTSHHIIHNPYSIIFLSSFLSIHHNSHLGPSLSLIQHSKNPIRYKFYQISNNSNILYQSWFSPGKMNNYTISEYQIHNYHLSLFRSLPPLFILCVYMSIGFFGFPSSLCILDSAGF